MKHLSTLLLLAGMAGAATAHAQMAPPSDAPPPSDPPPPPGPFATRNAPWWAGEDEIPYEPGVPGPPGWLYREELSTGLVIAGSVSFGAAYVMGAFTAAQQLDSTEDERWEAMFIPVVGPAVTSGLVDASTAGTFLLVADSVVQAAGIGMFILGLTDPDRSWVNPSLEVGVTPGGVQLSGSF